MIRQRLLCLTLILAVTCACLPAMAQTQSGKTVPCTLSVMLDTPVTATTKVLSALAGTSQTVFVNGVATTTTVYSAQHHICDVWYRIIQGGTARAFGLQTGTGTNCGTGTASLTPQWTGTASVTEDVTRSYGGQNSLVVPKGKDACLSLSGAPTGAQILISYADY